MNEKLKSIPKGFVSNEIIERLLNEIMEIRGINSRSHIIREAIFEYRKISKAPYLNETAAGKLKERKLKEMETEALVTPEMFAEKIKAPIVVKDDGSKWVRVRGLGNLDRVIRLEKIKEVWDVEAWLRNSHNEFVGSGGIILSEYIQDPFPRE